jgi:hypothetical protein
MEWWIGNISLKRSFEMLRQPWQTEKTAESAVGFVDVSTGTRTGHLWNESDKRYPLKFKAMNLIRITILRNSRKRNDVQWTSEFVFERLSCSAKERSRWHSLRSYCLLVTRQRTEDLLTWNCKWEYGRRRDPSRWPRGTIYPKKLALTLATNGGRSVGIVRSRTQTTTVFSPRLWDCVQAP